MPTELRSRCSTLRGPTGRSTVRKYCVKTVNTMPGRPVPNIYGRFEAERYRVGRASDEAALTSGRAREGAANSLAPSSGRNRRGRPRCGPVLLHGTLSLNLLMLRAD